MTTSGACGRFRWTVPAAFLPLLGACGTWEQNHANMTGNEERLSTGASEHSWRRNEPVPVGGRSNPYGLTDSEHAAAVRNGRLAALDYPVHSAGLQIPFETLNRTLAPGPKHPALAAVQWGVKQRLGFSTLEGLEDWLGLSSYPQDEGDGAFFVPLPRGPSGRGAMGRTVFDTPVAPGRLALTYSCAACHADTFFGRQVLGMSNRFPRANEFFVLGAETMSALPQFALHPAFGVVQQDAPVFRQLKTNVNSIEGVTPLALGLDTSLALVGLSLSRRVLGGHAEFDPQLQKRPRENLLRHARADSKPAVWWNARYKNRWLSDGSVVSGNPLFTNILWNEIGRGADLQSLADWFENNTTTVRDLTTAVFDAQAPTWFEIFGDRRLDLDAARRGQIVYERMCASCHGSFDKVWEDAPWIGIDLNALTAADKARAARTKVFRPLPLTPVVDVGTDPARYLGMVGLLELNELDLSKTFGTVVEAQRGYVPPPLVGIFARYPYLHNNAVPTLCDLLTPAAQRPRQYVARRAEDPNQDFDWDCVGYPSTAESSPAAPDEFVYRAVEPGLQNTGHDEGIFLRNGQPLWQPSERLDLIEFLKTL